MTEQPPGGPTPEPHAAPSVAHPATQQAATSQQSHSPEATAAYYAQYYAGVAAAQNPPKKPKGWFGRGFGAGLGLTLGAGLMVMLLQIPLFFGMLAFIGAASSVASSDVAEPEFGKATASKTIDLVPVSGVIMGSGNGSDPFGLATYGYEVAKKIDGLDKEKSSGLILEMDTPGGTIFGSKAIADAVLRYKERTGNKVTAYVRGTSASGGMMAMVPADEIIADHGTFVGSIGVIFGPFSQYENVTKENGLLGSGVAASKITKEYIAAGRGKDFGNSFRAMTEEERAHYTKEINTSYDQFVDHVAKHRNLPAAKIKDEIGAHLYGPEQAIENGLIDKKLGEQEAYKHIITSADLPEDDTKIVRAKDGSGFLMSLLTAKVLGKKPATTWTPGVTPPTPGAQSRASICTAKARALVLHGDLTATCGS